MPPPVRVKEFWPTLQTWVRPAELKTQRPAPIAICGCGKAFLRDIGQPSALCRPCRKKRNASAGAASQRKRREADPAGYRAYHAAKTRETRLRHPERRYPSTPAAARASKLRRNFGMTVAEYEARLSAQGGVCAICSKADRTGRRLAVDHCHSSGVVRGLLCAMCNTAIGKLGDSPELLRKALAYLESRHA